jgi:hypothetical protein
VTTFTDRPDHGEAVERRHDAATLFSIGLLVLALIIYPDPVAILVDLVVPGTGIAVARILGVLLALLWLLILVRMSASEDAQAA